ncbi:hypothetical protein GOBAR_DD15905 [Gossypium barbadense]|nr:hypothetical protein GOBAR_DD15905 [Gossypium barbadense]
MGKKWNRLSPGYSARLRAGPSALSRTSSFSSAAAGKAGGAPPLPQLSEADKTLPIYTWPHKKKPRVCILGGGFGGLYTALRLESLLWPEDKKPQVLLVDQSERFVFKPMLYELLSGEVDEWEIAPRFSELLANTGVEFLQDRPGWFLLWELKLNLMLYRDALEFALPFSTLEDACRVDEKLKTLERTKFGKDSFIRVAVVGCGYSGVELAATISERLQDRGIVQAINVESTICPTAPTGNREAALKRVSDVEASGDATVIREGKDIAKQNSEKYVLELQPAEKGLESQNLEADLVLWTVGSKPLLPELEPCDKPHELPLNARGQAETDETLRVKGHPRIFALGDSASLRDSTGKLLPATAQVAFQQADFASWNLWAAINHRPLLPFRFQNLGEMMTLGRNDAAISPSFVDGLTLEGPIGHAARKLAYLIRLPTEEHRFKVGLSWFAKSAVDSVALLQSTLTKGSTGGGLHVHLLCIQKTGIDQGSNLDYIGVAILCFWARYLLYVT